MSRYSVTIGFGGDWAGQAEDLEGARRAAQRAVERWRTVATIWVGASIVESWRPYGECGGLAPDAHTWPAHPQEEKA